MPFLKGLFCLAKITFARYWFWILWSGICMGTFRGEYLHYKVAPQFHYLRKMLGCGICISRGSAAVLNVSALAIVLTTCRNLYSLISIYLPAVIHKKFDSIVVSSKSNHLAVAGTIVLTSILHTVSHIANAINSSRNFVVEFPAANLATFRGESPSILIFTTVPGITGIVMMTILILLCLTSLRIVRRRNYERFYYTHHCGLLYLILILMHPISGVIKSISNIDSHHPNCNFLNEPKSMKKEILEEEAEFSTFTNAYLFVTKVKKPEVDFTLPKLYMDLMRQDYIANKGRYKSGIENPAELLKNNNIANSLVISNQKPIYPIQFKTPTLPLDEDKITETKTQNMSNIEGLHTTEDEYSMCTELDKLFYRKPQFYAHQESLHMDTKKNKNIVKQRPQNFSFENKLSNPNKEQGQSCHLPPIFTPVQSKAWMWICSALILWLIEFSVGYMRGRGKVKLLQVVHYPNCDIAELFFSKEDFACYPGQYVLLRCPQVSLFQWHPFTIARCPVDNDGVLTVVMKTKGDWCDDLIGHIRRTISTSSRPNTPSNLQDVEHQPYYGPKLFTTDDPKSGKEDYEINKLKNSLLTVLPIISYERELSTHSHKVGKFNRNLECLSVAKEEKPVSSHQSIFQLKNITCAEKLNSAQNAIECQKSLTKDSSKSEFNFLNKNDTFEETVDVTCNLPKCRIVYDIDDQLTEKYCVRFYMNGPFNSVNEKLFSYNVVIGIAGGVGITPFIASLTHIIQTNENCPSRIHIVWMLRNLQLITPIVSLFQSLADKFWNNQQEDRMEVRLHCTSNSVTNETLAMFKKNYPYLGARLHRGRPDWKNLFEVWMDCYKRSRVGVFCTGPKSLNRKVNEHILDAATKGINFSYHHESFS